MNSWMVAIFPPALTPLRPIAILALVVETSSRPQPAWRLRSWKCLSYTRYLLQERRVSEDLQEEWRLLRGCKAFQPRSFWKSHRRSVERCFRRRRQARIPSNWNLLLLSPSVNQRQRTRWCCERSDHDAYHKWCAQRCHWQFQLSEHYRSRTYAKLRPLPTPPQIQHQVRIRL